MEVIELDIEAKKDILILNMREFLELNDIEIQDNYKYVWPSLDYQITVGRNRKNKPELIDSIYVYDYIGIGHRLESLKGMYDYLNEIKKKGLDSLKYVHFNCSYEQLVDSVNYVNNLLEKYGLSIYQKISTQESYALQNARIRMEKEMKSVENKLQ